MALVVIGEAVALPGRVPMFALGVPADVVALVAPAPLLVTRSELP